MSSGELRIRDARPSDRDAIAAVTLSAYQEYALSLPEVWEGYKRNILATLASPEAAEQIVAEKSGQLVGAVLLYPARTLGAQPGRASTALPWPEVRLLAVAPVARGQGVGTALVLECVTRGRRSGAQALTLHTTDVMRAAMRLYERLGFHRASELDLEPAPGVVAKGYRLDLTGTASHRPS
jgi:GNAT superfamily N-acetyltransferase